MKAYVNKSTGEVFDRELKDDAVINTEKNKVGHVTFANGLPEGELVSYIPEVCREEAGSKPEYDDRYQTINETWSWNNSQNKMIVEYSVVEWRTQAEAEAEAAAAALDVTPDSA